jgi:cephalosporin hydroxylase
MDPISKFEEECRLEIKRQGENKAFAELTRKWFDVANALKYSYHFRALDRPIIQYPQDIVAVQELIWDVKPDLIIETGIAHGGSLILSASVLALIDYCEAVESDHPLVPSASKRRVLGIDIDIRDHNRAAIEAHPLAHKIDMIMGSSIDPAVVDQVRDRAKGFEKVMIFLDSNHTHDHVLAELEAYAPLTSKGSYCVAFDTVIEDLPATDFADRPWSVGNNPKTAVWEYMSRLENEGRKAADGGQLMFEIDRTIDNKIMVTVAPEGYLKRIG